MNDKLFLIGLIIFLVGIFFAMITPVIWCYVGENISKFSCCFPIFLNSMLIVTGVCLLVISTT